MSKETLLEYIRNRMVLTKHQFKYSNSDKCYWEDAYTLLKHDVRYLFDTITQQNERIQELERFKEYFDELYGQGLEVAEWHMNGDLESFDNFYDSAIEHMEGDSDE